MKIKTTCLGCGKRFSSETFNGIERKYCSHKCSREYKKERLRIQKDAIKKLLKLGVRERQAIRYVHDYIPNPSELTNNQIKDICSSFYASYEVVKKNLPLEKYISESSSRYVIDKKNFMW